MDIDNVSPEGELINDPTEGDPTPPPLFDPYRIAATPTMQNLVKKVSGYLLNVEQHQRLRTRARRPRDLEVFHKTMEALLSDLAYQSLIGHQSIRVTRSKDRLASASRYESDLMSKQLPYILDVLTKQMGVLRMELGYNSPFGGKQTEISASPWLMKRFAENSIGLHDTDRREGEELILLKGTKFSLGRSALAEYTDDALTDQYRAEVKLINGYLRKADICFDSDASSGLVVDDRNRYLRRIFTRGSFGTGGRLFGGFWQPLGKRERLASTTINGESVVSLDYKAMIASLAYASVHATPPTDDAYVTTFQAAKDSEPVTLQRSTVKKLFAAAMFAESPLKQWPDGLRAGGRGLPVSVVLAGIKQAHPALVPLMFKGLGHALQFSESEILIDALLKLIDLDIPALPVHDCLVVPQSALEVTQGVMENTFAFHTGATARIAAEYPE